jgi:hypothetical protein
VTDFLTGLVNSKGGCRSLSLSWDLLGHHVREPLMKLKRSPASRDNAGCSCAAQCSLPAPDAVTTPPTVPGIPPQPSDTSNRGAMTPSSAGRCISSMRTTTSAAQPLQSPTATTPTSSDSEVVCIIKAEDLNSTPPGVCYCFDGTTREWQTGGCQIYS